MVLKTKKVLSIFLMINFLCIIASSIDSIFHKPFEWKSFDLLLMVLAWFLFYLLGYYFHEQWTRVSFLSKPQDTTPQIGFKNGLAVRMTGVTACAVATGFSVVTLLAHFYDL